MQHFVLTVLTVAFLQGANFRNLLGVRVGSNRVVKLDETIERARCTSGKPLVLIIEELFDPLWFILWITHVMCKHVPDYALSFEEGKSC